MTLTQVDQRKIGIDKSLQLLPALPTAVVELLSLDPESDDYPSQMADLIAREPSLAVRVLSAANSAASGPQQPIRSIPQAITRLGARRAGQLVTAAAVIRVFVPTTEAHYNLWRDALQVAVASKEIAHAGGRGVDPNEAYVVGLLHDIGRFVMYDHAPEDLKQVEEFDHETAASLVKAERQVCGHDHCELGWRACNAWSIPEGIGLAIKNHHAGRLHDSGFTPVQVALVRTLQQADRLSSLMLYHADALEQPSAKRTALLAAHCFSTEWEWPPVRVEQLDSLVDPIAAKSNEMMLALGVGRIRKDPNTEGP